MVQMINWFLICLHIQISHKVFFYSCVHSRADLIQGEHLQIVMSLPLLTTGYLHNATKYLKRNMKLDKLQFFMQHAVWLADKSYIYQCILHRKHNFILLSNAASDSIRYFLFHFKTSMHTCFLNTQTLHSSIIEYKKQKQRVNERVRVNVSCKHFN